MTKALAARLREELVKLADSPAAFGLHCYLNRPAILSALEAAEETPPGQQDARSALYCVIAHWDEFGPEHGFAEAIDLARAALKVKP